MGGPWEKYKSAQAESGPWEKYAQPQAVAPEAPQKPSTIDLATQGLLMGAEGDIEDARAAAQDIYKVGKEAAPIALAVGGGAIHPGLAPAGYALGKAGVKTLEAATGEREAAPMGQSLKEFGGDVIDAAMWQMGGEKAVAGVKATTKYLTTKAPEKLYASATKMPLSKKWKQVLPGEEVSARQKAVRTGLEGGILPNERGLAEVRKIINATTQEIDSIVKEGASRGMTVKTQDILKSLERSYGAADASSDPIIARKMVDRIAEKFTKGHGEEIPVDKALSIKRQIGKEVSFGKYQNLVKEATKDLRFGINDELKKTFPALKGLNAKDEAYIKLQEAIEGAVGRLANNDIVSLGDKALAAAGAATGSPSGILAVISQKVLALPTIKARMAIALHKIGQRSAGGANLRALSAGGQGQVLNDSKTQAILKSSIPEEDKARFLTQEYLKQDGFKALPADTQGVYGPEGQFVINRAPKVIRRPAPETKYYKKIDDAVLVYDPAKDSYYALPDSINKINKARSPDILDLAKKSISKPAESVSKTSDLLETAAKSQRPKTWPNK